MDARGLGNDPPYVRPRKNGESEDIDAIIQLAVQEAVSYVDDELGPERAIATEFYQGKPFGNEMEGRSRAILTEVRDGIIGVLPSILRVVHGPEHAVEFVPKKGEAVGMAEQATDYVRWVYEEDNAGFTVTHSVLKDGLLKRLGIVKWGMDDTPEAKTVKYAGITREQLAMLMENPSAELGNVQIVGDGLLNAEVTTVEPSGRMWVQPIPPDDFFWNREARSLNDAILVGHRARLTRGQLRQMGVSEDDLEEYGQTINVDQITPEEQARRHTDSGISLAASDPMMGKENQRVLYCEVYMTLDVHGTGIPELRKICTLGDNFHPIKNDPAKCRPFAVFSPDPEPHALLGGSWYDRLKDAQLINSQLLRGMLDSLAISLFPRVAYVDGQASVADVMNTAIGAPIRERQPNMVRSFDQPFTGEKVLPILGMMREVVERRIGNKDGAGSLDMDALQSTGKEAVNAAITAAQAQPELLARLFAEQVLKPMFKGLLELACLPQSKERILRLRGTYVPVNPQSFDPTMDVSVNVALGSLDTAKKVSILKEVVADQTAILQEYGPENPVVNLSMLRNAKAKVLALQGIKDVENYYLPVDPNYQPPPPPPPQPTPDEMWIEAEKQMAFEKQMKELAIKNDELRLNEEKTRAELDLKDRELALKEREMALREMEQMQQSATERYKTDANSTAKDAEIASRESLERERLALEARKIELDAELRKMEAETQVSVAKANADVQAKAQADAKEKDDAKASEKEKEKPEPMVVNIQAPPAPNVTVKPPVVNVAAPKRGKRTATVKGNDGTEYTIETEDAD